MDVSAQTERSSRIHAYSGQQLQNYPRLLLHLLNTKSACAWANSRLGIISPSDYEKIDTACKYLQQHPELFTADLMQGGGGIAVHMNINESLLAYLEEPEFVTKVSASQSTTDVCATALSLTLAQSIHTTQEHLRALTATLLLLAERHMQLDTRGRTCLRDAGLLKFGERFKGFASLFARHDADLARFSNFAYSNLGGTALGTGEGIAAEHRESYSEYALARLQQLTPIPIRLHPNFIDSVQNRDDLFDLASCLESFASSLFKMAKDIRLLASGPEFGFNEIKLPALIKGSTFYANKINPTLEETVIQMCFSVLGLVRSAKLGIEHSELDMNIYYLHGSICLLDAFNLVNNLVPKYIQYSLMELTINKL